MNPSRKDNVTVENIRQKKPCYGKLFNCKPECGNCLYYTRCFYKKNPDPDAPSQAWHLKYCEWVFDNESK